MVNKRERLLVMNRILPVLFLFICHSGLATSYYVSSTGNDLNTGTSIASAWATIGKVNSTDFLPGDALYFEGSHSFSGNISLTSSDANDPNNIFTISSFGTGRATINAGTSFGLYAYNTQGFTVTNINFDGNTTATNTGAGIMVYADLSGDKKFSNISISYCEIKNFGGEGVKIYAWNNLTGFQNISLLNLSVHDVTKNGIEIYGFFTQTLVGWANKNVSVSGCEVYNVPGSPVSVQYEGNGIVMASVDGGIIQNCVAHDVGQNNTFCGGPVGIWSLESNNVTIQFCESYNNHRGTSSGCDGGGFDLDGGVTNSTIQYNYSHDNDGAGFLMGQYQNARPWSNNTLRYNISENDGRENKGSIDLFKGPGTTMSGANIYGNTIYVSKQPANTNAAAAIFEVWTTGINNVAFYNNIFITSGDVPLVIIPSGYAAFFAGNIYWPSGGNFSVNYQGSHYSTLDSWRAATGNEMVSGSHTGFNADPQLSNVGAGGTIGYGNSLYSLNAYKIQNIGSPAYHAALDLSSLYSINTGSVDFWGTMLPGGDANDIGSNQFVSILPTALLGFYGHCTGTGNTIFWKTAEELNMKSFDLMYSGDGQSFHQLVSMEPRGSYSGYQYVNDAASAGNNYYQLRMVDLDGSVALSAILNISCGKPANKIKVWPNPFTRSVDLSIESLADEPATLTLFDVMGKMLIRKDIQLRTGSNSFVFDGLSDLSPGTYYLRVEHQIESENFKLLKTGN